MKKPTFWEKAKKELIKKDKRLGKIINSYPKDFLFTKSDPFYTLARSIIGQQISVIAAQSVWDKLEKKNNKSKSSEYNELTLYELQILWDIQTKNILFKITR